jgi:hypothetical protein
MSFGTNASFTIQFTSVLFSLVGAIKVVPLGNHVIAKEKQARALKSCDSIQL